MDADLKKIINGQLEMARNFLEHARSALHRQLNDGPDAGNPVLLAATNAAALGVTDCDDAIVQLGKL